MNSHRVIWTVAVPMLALTLAACSRDTKTPAAPVVPVEMARLEEAGEELPTLAAKPLEAASFRDINEVSVPIAAEDAAAMFAVAGAAPGTLVRSITQPGNFYTHCPSGVNTGVAFDGTNLIMSCWSSNKLDLLRTSDASLVKRLTLPAPINNVGAMAWDGKQNRLWICVNYSSVYLVDTSDPDGNGLIVPGEVQFKFNTGGCVDGLAFDGADETIWSSPDASCTLSHYTKTGTLIATKNVCPMLGGSGNSGIAVGAGKLYLANNGGSQIWVANKPPTTSSLFATFPRRIEDLECDDITFSNDGIATIWQQDAYDRQIQAYAIEPNACPFGGFDVPQVVMDLHPNTISVNSSPTVNVVLISTALFNAVSANVANIRFVVNGNAGTAASVQSRGGVYVTSTRDWNGDGRVDRMVTFSLASLRAAGLAPGATNIVVQDLISATGKFQATDTVLPTFVP